MTHDELLAEIERLEELVAQVSARTDVYPALRAVVELHRPYEVTTGAAWTQSNGLEVLGTETLCRHCREMGSLKAYYPCPTIQAIEKELK